MTKENAKPDETAKSDRGELAPEPPRERIVACAQDLFHRLGIRGVGVETIAEAAGTNKMTLYRHFGSKDDLVCECLSRKGRMSEEIWAALEAARPFDPVGQLYGYVSRVAKFIAEDERGCDLANAAVELTEAGHPGLKVIEEFKKRQRDRLARLCEAAGAARPGLLADTIVLLIEGARVSRRSLGASGPSANFLQTSEAVIASFGVPARKERHSSGEAIGPERRGA